MAGQSWQTRHEPPGPQGKTGTRHTHKTVEKTEGRKVGKNRRFLAQSDIAGHGATLALFVVNFVKLHLTTVIMSVLGLITTEHQTIHLQMRGWLFLATTAQTFHS